MFIVLNMILFLFLDDIKRPTKTLSGLKAGLQNAETLRHETHELRNREKQQIEKVCLSFLHSLLLLNICM